MRKLSRNEEKSAKSNRQRNARKKLKYHVRYVLKVKPKKEKIRDYVDIFAKHYGINVIGNSIKWLYNLYNNSENEIIRKETGAFYSTREWKYLRKKVLTKYGYKCMKCGYNDKSNCVDHIKPRSKYKDLELEFNNMQVLCTICNLIKSDRSIIDYRTMPQQRVLHQPYQITIYYYYYL